MHKGIEEYIGKAHTLEPDLKHEYYRNQLENFKQLTDEEQILMLQQIDHDIWLSNDYHTHKPIISTFRHTENKGEHDSKFSIWIFKIITVLTIVTVIVSVIAITVMQLDNDSKFTNDIWQLLMIIFGIN